MNLERGPASPAVSSIVTVLSFSVLLLGGLGCTGSDAPPAGEDGASTDGASGDGGSTATGTPADAADAADVDASEAAATTRSEEIRRSVQAQRPALSTFVPQAKVGDPIAREGMKSTPSGLRYAVLQEGTGSTPALGSRVDVHITVWLQGGDKVGRQVWNSRDDETSHTYRLHDQTLVPGLVEAIASMKRGERRWVLIPADLGYGDVGYASDVPPDASLVVDVELVRFVSA